jgi:hypothetical protein
MYSYHMTEKMVNIDRNFFSEVPQSAPDCHRVAGIGIGNLMV